MIEEQSSKYLVWENRWQRPLFGAIKSMTHRQWLTFSVCWGFVAVIFAIILAEYGNPELGLIAIISFSIGLFFQWHTGRSQVATWELLVPFILVIFVLTLVLMTMIVVLIALGLR